MSFEDIYDQMERDEDDNMSMDEHRAVGAEAALGSAMSGSSPSEVIQDYAMAKYGHLDFLTHAGDRKDLVTDTLADLRYLSEDPKGLDGFAQLITALKSYCEDQGFEFDSCLRIAGMHLDAEFSTSFKGVGA